jgi:hypothetical protein
MTERPPITQLWQFKIEPDGITVYSRERPPPWSETMKGAQLKDAPAEICAEFERDALEQFRREYGAPLHTVTVEDGCPGYKRNARKA